MKKQIHPGLTTVLMLAALAGHAQNFDFKADNNTALNTASSWSNSIMPTASDWAVWDSTVSAANCTNEQLSGALSVGGIQVLNPPTAITITNIGKVLTIGNLGIDMSEPTTSADLYLVAQVTSQGGEWNIKPGRTLYLAEGASQAVAVTGDLAINGLVRLNDKDFRVETANLWLTNSATTLDFSSGALSFSVGYTANTTVYQTAGTVNLYKSSTSTGALLLGANGGGTTATYNLSGGTIVDTNATTADYASIGDGSGNVGTLNVDGGSITIPQFQIGNKGYAYINITNGSITTLNSPGGDFILNKGSASLGAWMNVYGGSVTVLGHNLVVGNNGTAGSSGNVTQAGGFINVGASLEVPGGTTVNPGVVTMTGGVMNVTNNVILLDSSGNGNGTVNLDGGTIIANSVTVGPGIGGVGAFNFDGGILQARAANGNFINAAVPAYIGAGGALINNAGFSITVAAPLLNGTGGGADGGLFLLGSGALTLASTNNTFAGPVTVSAGTLALNTPNAFSNQFVVYPGATLSENLTVNGQNLTLGSLQLGTGPMDATSLLFNLGTNSTLAAPPMVATNLTINGTNSINVFGSGLTLGVYPLIQYGGIAGGGVIQAGLVQGAAGYVTNNTTTHVIALVITGGVELQWGALASTNWDLVTLNWRNLSNNALPAAFSSGADALFDDTASNALVALNLVALPTSVTFNNNASNYVFGGTGAIGGTAGITKLGAAMVTMGLTNSYSGATIIGNGVFRLAANNAIPSASDATVEGKLDLAGYGTGVHSLNGNNGVVDNSGASPAVLAIGGNGGAFAGVITNSGASLALSKGGGTLILLNTNTYSGGTTNGGGGLQLGSEKSIGSGPLTLTGGTLYWVDANPHVLANALTVGGGVAFGAATNGALTVTSVANFAGSSHAITANTDVTFPNGIVNGGVNGKAGPGTLTLRNTVGDWNSGSLSVNLGAFVLGASCIVTQDGSNIRIQCGTNDIARLVVTNGSTLVMAGSETSNFRFGDSATGGVGATNILDLYGTLYLTPLGPTAGNDVLQMGSAADPAGVNIVNLYPGGLLKVRKIQDLSSASISYFNFNGGTLSPSTNDNAAAFMQGLDNAQVLGGGAVIDTAGYSIAIGQSLINDGVDEDGGLVKQGQGALYLNGASSYTNTTRVNAGALGGVGSLLSPVVVASGGALAAGPSSTTIGTFYILNTVTFAPGGGAVMKISKISGTAFSDNVSGISTLNYNGMLVVTTNVDMTDVFAIGDVFTLFSATTYSGSFASISLPALPPGMAWDTSQLGVNGSIQILARLAFNPVVLQSAGSLVLSGSGGTAFGNYRVYASTNIAPPSNWIPIATNQFDGSGDFIFTNTIDPATPAQFFEISNP